jgi:general secretion pathway protein L
MSILAILLPPRERLSARAAVHEASPGVRLPAEWTFLFSADERSATRTGQALPGDWPKADRLVLVLADADVSWHRLDVPKAPAARLRAALVGVLEEALLEDEDALHLALAPDAVPGRPGWVAVTHRPRLQAALAALEGAGLSVERVVVANLPGAGLRGHFHGAGAADLEAAGAPWLTLSGPDGAWCVRLQGGLARALQPPQGTEVNWTATPAVCAAAERWLGAPPRLMSESERLLEAVQSAQGQLNLRQFDLAARHRGMRALREAGSRLMSREWRLVRYGLTAALAVQLLGLNLQAWQQRQAIVDKRLAMTALLRQTHPGVRSVLDAPLQMQRETERLRAASGRAGDSDLEALLGAAASAWPDGQGPAQMLHFETGRLTVAAADWAEPQLTQFRDRLRATGYGAELSEGKVTLSRQGSRGNT